MDWYRLKYRLTFALPLRMFKQSPQNTDDSFLHCPAWRNIICGSSVDPLQTPYTYTAVGRRASQNIAEGDAERVCNARELIHGQGGDAGFKGQDLDRHGARLNGEFLGCPARL